MVVEHELLPYWTWLLGDWWRGGGHLGAALSFVIVLAVLALIGIVIGYLVALVRYGPLKAGDLTYRVVSNGVVELARTSRRRVIALARHAVKESWRRRVFVALIVFFVVLLFAGWFLQTGHREPGKLFFSFALTTTTYLVLFIALLVSAFSLPQEFKSKTIFTLVTKPVRAGDIILGRILGLTVIGTLMLIVMAVSNYVFVSRMLDHTHEVELASLTAITDADGKEIGKSGRTSATQSHRHEVELDASGNGIALFAHTHEHAVTAGTQGGGQTYKLTGPLDVLRARVPYYGKLRFERNGVPTAGSSVGAEWTYRRFIEGGTSDTAIWTFSDIDASQLRTMGGGEEVLPLELIVRVFRTYKGIIGQGIQGSMKLRNPETGLESFLWTFTAKDASGGVASAEGKRQGDELPSINYFAWPRKLDDKDQNAIDLLKDLVSKDGQLEVHVQCLEPQQYYGFAQPDGFVRRADGAPWWNFCKAQISIWIQMLMVIAIAVAASTLVNGPVAMLFTASFILIGFFREFFVGVATGTEAGGGPIESFIRLVTQRNLMTGLQEGESTAVDLMKAADWVLQKMMLSMAYVLPDFRAYSTVDYVANGYDIPINKVFQDLTMATAYVAGLCVFAYYFLKTREVAK
jgi:ABC-type transport system involved in multi-copper enzyme maturation permease subunit